MIQKRQKHQVILLIFAFCFSLLFNISAKTKEKPNVVFFLIDDWGWKDAGCQGSTFYETPNIDKLAENGVRFTNAYAAHSKCIASRLSILTGKYPARLKCPGKESTLPIADVSLAEAFKANGYATFFTGKWHLGAGVKSPENQGFDINKGGGKNGMPATYYFPYQKEGSKANVYGLEDGADGEYLTDRLTDETVKFIEEHAGEPFFAFVSHYAVHEPIEPKLEYVDKFEKKIIEQNIEFSSEELIKDGAFKYDMVQNNADYAAMLQSIDESLQRIVEALKAKGILDNTIIVVTSDNGGKNHNPFKIDRNQPTCNLPLRRGKSLLHEGGIRIPLIISWNKQIPKGSVSNYPTMGTDHYASLLELSGLESIPEQHLDSYSYVDALYGKNGKREYLFWNFPQNSKSIRIGYESERALRRGDYKLIKVMSKPERFMMYNLKEDLGESENIAEKEPEKTKELIKLMDKVSIDIGALDSYVGSKKPN